MDIGGFTRQSFGVPARSRDLLSCFQARARGTSVFRHHSRFCILLLTVLEIQCARSKIPAHSATSTMCPRLLDIHGRFEGRGVEFALSRRTEAPTHYHFCG